MRFGVGTEHSVAVEIVKILTFYSVDGATHMTVCSSTYRHIRGHSLGGIAKCNLYSVYIVLLLFILRYSVHIRFIFLSLIDNNLCAILLPWDAFSILFSYGFQLPTLGG